jgi:large subunit ribosomal protein L32e
MIMDKKLFELKNKIKSKMPKFIRSGAYKKKKLDIKWRKPKGGGSKVRFKFRGHRSMLKIGYGSPVEVKHFLRSGFRPVMVSCVNDLNKIVDKKHECAMISGTVGLKKKIDIVKKAKESSIVINNVKNVDLFLKEVDERLKSKKSAKEQALKSKETKKKEREEKAKEKEDKDKKENSKLSDDELAKKVEDEEKKKKEEEEKLLISKKSE